MRFRFLLVISCLPLSLLAQLSGPGSKSVRYTTYLSTPGVRDPIFFYCNRTGLEKGTLTAIRPGGTGTYDFSWYKWNDVAGSFSTFIRSETGVTSTVSGLDWGGYKVQIDSSGFQVASLTGWIFFDTPPIAEASLQQQLCNRVALKGRAEVTTANFYYKDPVTAATISLPNARTFLWSSTPTSVIPTPDIELNPVTYLPPLFDVTYNLNVNSLGCSNDSSFFYESIHVKAEFTADPTEGEAPLEVILTDKSIRADIYLWDFGDDTVSRLKDPVPHIYYKPGEYYINLTIESELHCIGIADSIKITVEPSDLDIPNVFTPDDDGYNDRFRIVTKSLRFVSMEVFSQSGMKVYGFSGEGERLKEWDGWDGRINNSSTEARPGIYFYIIRALGWDDISYDSEEYRGFVYLYR